MGWTDIRDHFDLVAQSLGRLNGSESHKNIALDFYLYLSFAWEIILGNQFNNMKFRKIVADGFMDIDRRFVT